jgi:hypothetical protein
VLFLKNAIHEIPYARTFSKTTASKPRSKSTYSESVVCLLKQEQILNNKQHWRDVSVTCDLKGWGGPFCLSQPCFVVTQAFSTPPFCSLPTYQRPKNHSSPNSKSPSTADFNHLFKEISNVNFLGCQYAVTCCFFVEAGVG